MQKDKKDFTIPDPKLAVGSKHSGFSVTAIHPISELSATGYELRHDASGARALWLACNDVNKSFAISFKTPPANDTGVFHILEHSVLCGSDRFPVKEPFVNLIKTSMQTFLNAMTFPDKTMYPVASTNERDLENLMDVYLDAVLHPAIYQRPRIFEQEGWHYELAGEGDDAQLMYNGVVFNEMKGAFSDPDEIVFDQVSRALFPDTPYRFVSGGDPHSIPQLSYEQFVDTHARHYNLANSYTILYGDLDIERELAFINKRFEQAVDRGVGKPNALPMQAPIQAGLSQVKMATAPENASVALAYVFATADERTRVLAADVLLDTLAGSNEAPLKRAVLEAGLGQDFNTTLIDAELQPQVIFQLKGAKPGVAKQFRELVEHTCARLVAEGIERERLEASLAQAEFNLREGDWGVYADGVALSMQVMSSWLYNDDNPVAYLYYEDALAHLKDAVKTGGFEQLLDEMVVHSQHSCAVELIPTDEGAADAEAAELAKLRAQMSADQLAAIADEVAVLRAEQEAPDAPEDIALLPRLHVSDIKDAPEETPATLDETAPLPCYAYDLDTHGIDYVWHYFDLRRFSFDELPYVSMLTDLLGKLDTTEHDASALDMLIERELGFLSFSVEAYGRDEDSSFVHPLLVVRASALADKTAALATLPAEVWGKTLYTDTDRIYNLLVQHRIAMEQNFIGAGHRAAMAALATHYSAAAKATAQMGGVEYYLFLKDLLDHWDERKDALIDILINIAQRIFTADEMSVSFAGSTDSYKRFWDLGGTLGLSKAGKQTATHQLEIALPDPDKPMRQGYIIPSDVCYVGEAQPRSMADSCSLGAWMVASRALSFDYLWNEVRVKGGAYGTGFQRNSAGVSQFWSYRDPDIDGTIVRYEGASSWLAQWSGGEDELEGYIVSSVATHDTPLKPRQIARRQDSQRFAGKPHGWRHDVRKQMLATTAEDLHAMAASLRELHDRRSVVVFGGKDKLKESQLNLTLTQLMDEAN